MPSVLGLSSGRGMPFILYINVPFLGIKKEAGIHTLLEKNCHSDFSFKTVLKCKLLRFYKGARAEGGSKISSDWCAPLAVPSVVEIRGQIHREAVTVFYVEPTLTL